MIVSNVAHLVDWVGKPNIEHMLQVGEARPIEREELPSWAQKFRGLTGEPEQESCSDAQPA